MRRLLTIVLSLLVVSCGADSQGESVSDGSPPVLKFTAIPGEDPTRMREKFGPVAQYLEAELGVPVEYVHATKYPAAVEMFKNGDVLLAWFGGLTGVQARAAVDGATAIAQGVEDPSYRSYFIVNAAVGIEPSEDFPHALAGRTFTFGAKTSTSGRLMPEHFIRTETGKAPAEFFAAAPGISGSHDLTCERVEKGAFDAGAVSYTTYDRRVREGKTDPEVCRILWTTPPYPDYSFTAHPDLEKRYGAGFTAELQRALLGMKGEALLGGFQRSGMIEAQNSDFARIEDLARDLGMLRPH